MSHYFKSILFATLTILTAVQSYSSDEVLEKKQCISEEDIDRTIEHIMCRSSISFGACAGLSAAAMSKVAGRSLNSKFKKILEERRENLRKLRKSREAKAKLMANVKEKMARVYPAVRYADDLQYHRNIEQWMRDVYSDDYDPEAKPKDVVTQNRHRVYTVTDRVSSRFESQIKELERKQEAIDKRYFMLDKDPTSEMLEKGNQLEKKLDKQRMKLVERMEREILNRLKAEGIVDYDKRTLQNWIDQRLFGGGSRLSKPYDRQRITGQVDMFDGKDYDERNKRRAVYSIADKSMTDFEKKQLKLYDMKIEELEAKARGIQNEFEKERKATPRKLRRAGISPKRAAILFGGVVGAGATLGAELLFGNKTGCAETGDEFIPFEGSTCSKIDVNDHSTLLNFLGDPNIDPNEAMEASPKLCKYVQEAVANLDRTPEFSDYSCNEPGNKMSVSVKFQETRELARVGQNWTPVMGDAENIRFEMEKSNPPRSVKIFGIDNEPLTAELDNEGKIISIFRPGKNKGGSKGGNTRLPIQDKELDYDGGSFQDKVLKYFGKGQTFLSYFSECCNNLSSKSSSSCDQVVSKVHRRDSQEGPSRGIN